MKLGLLNKLTGSLKAAVLCAGEGQPVLHQVQVRLVAELLRLMQSRV